LFGNIVDANPCGCPNICPEMKLNHAGKMLENEWLKLPERFQNIQLHEYIVMPNHFHAILEIVVGATLVVAQNDLITKNDVITQNNVVAQNDVMMNNRATTRVAPTGRTLGEMMGAFQSITSVEYIHGVKNKNWQPFNKKLWHRNYWEHIIRNDNEHNRIVQYIIKNPLKWDNDKLNGGNGNMVMENPAEYNYENWMI